MNRFERNNTTQTANGKGVTRIVDTGPPVSGNGLTHHQIQLAFSGLTLGTLLTALDQAIVATALPAIVGELGGLQHLSWVITAYPLTATTDMKVERALSLGNVVEEPARRLNRPPDRGGDWWRP